MCCFCGFVYVKRLCKKDYFFCLNILKVALEGLTLFFLLYFVCFTIVNIGYPFLGAICGAIYFYTLSTFYLLFTCTLYISLLIILIILLYNYIIFKKPGLKKLGFNDYPAFYNLLLDCLS